MGLLVVLARRGRIGELGVSIGEGLLGVGERAFRRRRVPLQAEGGQLVVEQGLGVGHRALIGGIERVDVQLCL